MDDKEKHRRELYEKHLEKERERSKRRYAADKEYYNRKSAEWYAAHKDKWRNEYAQRRRELHGDRDRKRERERYWANPELARQRDRDKRARQKAKDRAKYDGHLKLRRYAPHKHYLSRDKYEEIYPRLAEGPCEICGVKGKMKIDHCHKQNIFRGVICDGCNRGLGFFKENPFAMIAAVKYLERPA